MSSQTPQQGQGRESVGLLAARGKEPKWHPRQIHFLEAFRFWVKLGFISFGGPAGQIAIMHHELVERRRWLSNERFLHALNYCMLLPGPEAQQLATYIGWLMHRTWGGIVAGAFFVIPSIFVLLGLSLIYALYGNVVAVTGLLNGFKPVVVAIVVEAVLKIGGRALKRRVHFLIAALAFAAIYCFHVPFPIRKLRTMNHQGVVPKRTKDCYLWSLTTTCPHPFTHCRLDRVPLESSLLGLPFGYFR
jgi:chromate transport protein ChrA